MSFRVLFNTLTLTVALCAGLVASEAAATGMLDPCAGGDCVFVGVFSGNDLSPGMDKSVNVDAASGMDLDLIPVGSENEFDVSDLDSTIGLFTVDDDGDELSGTWSISAGTVDYVSVKAGNDFALYQYIPSATGGDWSTEELSVGSGNQPTLSHLTFWTKVPEPGTALLMLLAIAGLAHGGRRRS